MVCDVRLQLDVVNVLPLHCQRWNFKRRVHLRIVERTLSLRTKARNACYLQVPRNYRLQLSQVHAGRVQLCRVGLLARAHARLSLDAPRRKFHGQVAVHLVSRARKRQLRRLYRLVVGRQLRQRHIPIPNRAQLRSMHGNRRAQRAGHGNLQPR